MAATANLASLDLDLLKIFVSVADHASFSKAASALAITKGTVSRAIARLEDLVGAELLHRDTHKVSMSTAGAALYERTAPHLGALANAFVELPEREEEPSGQLRITAPYDFGVMVLPEIIARFVLRFPKVTFDLRPSNQRFDLVADGFDMAIRAAPSGLTDSNLTVRKLGAAEMRVYASPGYLARRGEPHDLADPLHEWIVFRPMLPLLPKRGRASFLTDDLFTVRELVRAGAGVGTMPSFVAAPYVEAGTIVRILPSQAWRGTGGLYLLYPARGRGNVARKVTAFRDFLIASLKAKPLV